jgi:DNA-binding transcriptional ArsR family regulator
MSGGPAPGTWSRVSIAAIADKRVSDKAFRVLAALGKYADARGYCYPPLATIAGSTGMSTRTARRHLRVLEDCGYLTTYRQKRIHGGGYGANAYQLQFPAPRPPSASLEREAEGEPSPPTGSVANGTSGHGNAIEAIGHSCVRSPVDKCRDDVVAIGQMRPGDRTKRAIPIGHSSVRLTNPVTSPLKTSPQPRASKKCFQQDYQTEIVHRIVAFGIQREEAWAFMFELDDQGEIGDFTERQRIGTLSDRHLLARLEAYDQARRGRAPASQSRATG